MAGCRLTHGVWTRYLPIVSTMPVAAAPAYGRWLSRIQAGAIAGGIWIALTYLSGFPFFGLGPTHPSLVLGQPRGTWLLAAGLVIVSAIGGWLGARRGQRDGVRGLAVVALGWALWSTGGGSVDQWLIERNPVPGPGTAGAYWALLPDYLLLAVAIALVLLVSGVGTDPGAARAGILRVKALMPLDADRAERRRGLLGLAVTIAVAAVSISLLMGPRLAATRQGQVFFAVAAGFWLAAYVARHVTKVQRAGWLWPAPLAVGLIGAVLAALRPELAPPYDRINIIPAWNLVRPLPVEMVSVGLLAILWHFRARGPEDVHAAAGASS